MPETIIETKGATKNFNGFVAVDEVDLGIIEGQALGIIGPNGAGKTTFFNLLTGMFPPTKGKIFFHDEDISRIPPYKRVKMGIVRTFQLVSVFNTLKVLDNLVLSNIRFREKLNSPNRFFLYSAHSAEILDLCMKSLQIMGLQDKANFMTEELSYGDKRKLEISIALSLAPRILLLDEPFAGLGDAEISEVLSLINSIKDKFTLVIIEHKISRIVDLVERLIVLHEGRLIADGIPEQVLCDDKVREVYWGKEEGLVCSV